MEAARVDHVGLDLADRVQARRHDPFALHLALLRGEELRVADPCPVEVVGQYHCGGDEWAGERSPPDLVDAGDPNEPVRAQGRFVPVEVLGYSDPHLSGGHTLTNAFPITLSIGTNPTPSGGSKRESPECALLSPST